MAVIEVYQRLTHELPLFNGWAHMTAFERTMLCCQRLAEEGVEIPSSLTLAGIIGKRDTRSILKGRQAFAKQLGERLKLLSNMPQDIPPEVAGHVLGIWNAAFSCAQQAAEVQIRALKEQTMQLSAHVALLEAEKEVRHD